MELKVGKRYLIVRNIDNNYLEVGAVFENKEIEKVIIDVFVDEISMSGKYVKFNSFVGFPPINQWDRINSVDVLEELPDKKIKDNGITQNNVYEKLLEVLTKMLGEKISV